MSENTVLEKSLMEQIVEATFSTLSGEQGFDDALVERLVQLARDEELTNASKLTALIKSMPGGRCETT